MNEPQQGIDLAWTERQRTLQEDFQQIRDITKPRDRILVPGIHGLGQIAVMGVYYGVEGYLSDRVLMRSRAAESLEGVDWIVSRQVADLESRAAAETKVLGLYDARRWETKVETITREGALQETDRNGLEHWKWRGAMIALRPMDGRAGHFKDPVEDYVAAAWGLPKPVQVLHLAARSTDNSKRGTTQ